MNGQCINRFEIVLILKFCFMIMTGTILLLHQPSTFHPSTYLALITLTQITDFSW